MRQKIASLPQVHARRGEKRRAAVKPMRLSLSASLGRTVRSLRESAGFTQEDFAHRCGFFRTYLSRIETGQANPTLTALEVLATALGMPASDMLRRAETHVG